MRVLDAMVQSLGKKVGDLSALARFNLQTSDAEATWGDDWSGGLYRSV